MDGAVRCGLVGGGFVVAACGGALEQHVACFGSSTIARVGFPLVHAVSSIFVSALASFQRWLRFSAGAWRLILCIQRTTQFNTPMHNNGRSIPVNRPDNELARAASQPNITH